MHHLGASEKPVRNDLKRIYSLWHERLGDDIEHQKLAAIVTFQAIQRAARDALQNSRDSSSSRHGYLNVIKSAEDSIVKILGLEAGQTLGFTPHSQGGSESEGENIEFFDPLERAGCLGAANFAHRS